MVSNYPLEQQLFHRFSVLTFWSQFSERCFNKLLNRWWKKKIYRTSNLLTMELLESYRWNRRRFSTIPNDLINLVGLVDFVRVSFGNLELICLLSGSNTFREALLVLKDCPYFHPFLSAPPLLDIVPRFWRKPKIGGFLLKSTSNVDSLLEKERSYIMIRYFSTFEFQFWKHSPWGLLYMSTLFRNETSTDLLSQKSITTFVRVIFCLAATRRHFLLAWPRSVCCTYAITL